jgi:hypothetical protein
VRGTDPRIPIHTKMSRIRNTEWLKVCHRKVLLLIYLLALGRAYGTFSEKLRTESSALLCLIPKLQPRSNYMEKKLNSFLLENNEVCTMYIVHACYVKTFFLFPTTCTVCHCPYPYTRKSLETKDAKTKQLLEPGSGARLF